MRKLIALPFLLILFLSGCEDQIMLQQEFRQRYSLNCVIRTDTAYQKLTITKSYPSLTDTLAPGFSPFVKGAEVTLWCGDSVYIFKPDSMFDAKSGLYIPFYKINNFLAETVRKMDIEAIMPDNHRLISYADAPLEPVLNEYETDDFIPTEGKTNPKLVWYDLDVDYLYYIRLELVYKKPVNGVDVRFLRVVPVAVDNVGGTIRRGYTYPSRTLSVSYEQEAIDQVLRDISEGDPNKASYKIYSITVTLYAFEKNLSAYYASSNREMDEFASIVNTADFSNIQGGYGIFGSYSRRFKSLKFLKEYIESFGYTLMVEN